MAIKAKFQKGQIVFKASRAFATVGDAGRNDGSYIPEVRIGVVMERQIDACGQKQATFFARSEFNDSVFGKKINLAYDNTIFATQEEAFATLCADKSVSVICPDVYSDADGKSFDDLKSGLMRIASK